MCSPPICAPRAGRRWSAAWSRATADLDPRRKAAPPGLARAPDGYPLNVMLPPPDPYETSGPPPDLDLASPWAVFLAGPPSDEEHDVADAVLRFRPGLLFVANP